MPNFCKLIQQKEQARLELRAVLHEKGRICMSA